MSAFKKELKRILREHPVADLRGAFIAIETLVEVTESQPKAKPPKPLLSLNIVKVPHGAECQIKHGGDADLDILLAGLAIKSLNQFIESKKNAN